MMRRTRTDSVGRVTQVTGFSLSATIPNTLGKPVEEIGLKREFDWRVIYQCCGGCSRMVRQKSSVSVGSKAAPACCLILLQGFFIAERCPFGSFGVSSSSRTRYRPLPWRHCRYEHPDVLSRGGLSSPRLDRAALYVAQQSFNNQPHEEEA